MTDFYQKKINEHINYSLTYLISSVFMDKTVKISDLLDKKFRNRKAIFTS